MTVDIEKLKALALAAPKNWYGIYQIADGVTCNDAAALMKACNPAAVLELIAEIERLRAELATRCRAEGGDTNQVGCERDDGLLNIHAESETCEVCAAPAAGAVEKDATRLDFLDEVNRKTNAHYGTQYGWKFDINHNRAALTDHNWPARTIREAIDAAIEASAKAGKEQG